MAGMGVASAPVVATDQGQIDTGARTSSIHSFGTRHFMDRGQPHVEFLIHPVQGDDGPEIACTAP
jgi:hypothetical protein